MKRTFIILTVLIIVLFAFKNTVIEAYQENIFGEQKPYQVKRQEFFDRLSLRYYGTSEYGEALNLVNNDYRITEFHTNETNVMIPSLDAIQRLHQKQTLLVIESITEKVAASAKSNRNSGESLNDVDMHSSKDDMMKSSMLYLFAAFFLISGVFTLLGFCKFQKRIKNKRNGWFPDEDDEPVITDDSILLDFDLSKIENKCHNN